MEIAALDHRVGSRFIHVLDRTLMWWFYTYMCEHLRAIVYFNN
jgi:hypothetical protein